MEKELKPFPPNVSFGGNMLRDPVNIAHMRCAADRWFEGKKAANMGLPPAASQSGSPFVPLSSRVMHGECNYQSGRTPLATNECQHGLLDKMEGEGKEGVPRVHRPNGEFAEIPADMAVKPRVPPVRPSPTCET